MEGQKVVLNVYDLSQGLSRQLSPNFLGKVIEGIWHTGIVVFGSEYYFGGGIQMCGSGRTPYGKPLKTIELGFTQVPKELFEEFLQNISPRYTAQTYNLLRHNCNNFSDEISQFLLGAGIPEFILKLPEEVINSPMGAVIMPMLQQFETNLRYGGVPQVPPSNLPLGTINFSQIQVPSASPASLSSPNAIANGVSQRSLSKELRGMGSAHKVPGASSSMASIDVVTEASTKKVEDGLGLRSTTVTDKLEEAKAKVQEEITREFKALMAEGHLQASEAAALATRRVMERHGRGAGLASRS